MNTLVTNRRSLMAAVALTAFGLLLAPPESAAQRTPDERPVRQADGIQAVLDDILDRIGALEIGVKAARIVFVTSTTHTGNLGGLAGADQICNDRALEAGLYPFSRFSRLVI